MLQGEPWAFDRHLVALQKYDGTTPTQDLSFTTAKFWVQLHNLPYLLLTTKAALSLGKTLGTITKPKDDAEMRGGNFMRVRVAVDITKPLCCGRKVSWDQTEKGWVSFLYERLPNICYWCGLLSHDDKDCVLWLNSKGMLTAADQQFGPWIRAPQFNPVRRAVVEVQGFERIGNPVTATQYNTESLKGKLEAIRDVTGTINTVELVDSPEQTHMEIEEHGGGVASGVDHVGSDISLSQSQNHGALNGGIDCIINSEAVTMDHNTSQLGQYSEMERINLEYKALIVKPNNTDIGEKARIEEGIITGAIDATFNPIINFTVGSGEQLHVGNGNTRANKARGRSKNTKSLARTTKQKLQRQIEVNANMGKYPNQPYGPKPKCSSLQHDETEDLGKKRRMEMEIETLCDVTITQLEAVEVVEQPRWAQ